MLLGDPQECLTERSVEGWIERGAFPNSCAYPWPCYAKIRLGDNEWDRSHRFTLLPSLRCYLIADFSPLGQPGYPFPESRRNEVSSSPLSAGHFVPYTDDARNIIDAAWSSPVSSPGS